MIYVSLMLIFIFSFIFSYFICKPIIRFSSKRNLFDNVSERKIRKEPRPRLGGFGIFVSIFFSLFIFLIACNYFEGDFFSLISNLVNINIVQFLIVTGALFSIFLIGLYDDLFDLSYKYKLLFEISAASLIFSAGIKITYLTIPLSSIVVFLGDYSFIFTVIWIVGITNSINFIDGVDGLAGGIISISVFFMIVISMINSDLILPLLLAPILGAVLGFLPFNRYPSKILMGDSGSLFLGMTLSILVLQTSNKAFFSLILILPISLLAIPILDIVVSVIRRLSRLKSPFSPDNDHIHHRLLKKGLSEKKVAYILNFITFYFSIIALLSILIPKEYRIILWILFFILTLSIVFYLNYINVKVLKKLFNGRNSH